MAGLAYGGDPDSVRQSQVAFDVTPTFTETRSAEYTPVIPIHMPGSIQVYKHTNSRNFEMTAHFVSRNASDAWVNMMNLQRLRGWLMPYFGSTDTLTTDQRAYRSTKGNAVGNQNTTDLTPAERDAKVRERIQSEGVQLRGAPPDILYLYAYSTSANDSREAGGFVNVNRVPVVMTNLSITYPEDVDYIPVYDPDVGPTDFTEPFPRKLDVTISMVETHSPREYEQFDLSAYKLGNLVNF